MNLRQSYQHMIRAYPGGWDAMAAALGMSRDGLENRVYERKTQRLHVETAMLMQSLSGTTYFAQAVATASGGVFVKLPEIDGIGNDELLQKWNALYSRIGELSGTFNDAIQDEEIDNKERDSLAAVGHDIHRLLQELLALTFRVYSKSEA